MELGAGIRKITDGAIITAIYAVVFLASRFIGGLLESYLYFLIPIPLIVYGYKYDIVGTITTAIATFAVSFLVIANPLSPLFYVLPGLIGGCIVSLLAKNKVGIFLEILVASLISFTVNILTMVIFGYLFDYDIVDDTLLIVNEIMNLFEMIGLDSMSFLVVKSIMVSIIPSILIITALIEGCAIYMLSHLLLIRLKLQPKFEIKEVLDVDNLHPAIGVGYIVSFILMLISVINISSSNETMFVMYSIFINLCVVYSLIMVFQGMVFIAKYTTYHKIKWLYFLAVISIIIFPFIVIGVGLLQNLFHFSKNISINNN